MSHEPVFLYVEDDPLSRTVMHSLITLKLGFSKLTIFEDSENFITHLEGLPEKPDVIFLDIHMKPYSGFEMIEMLRQHEHYCDTAIIALTASVMSEEVAQLKKIGFNGIIAKPIDLRMFEERLKRILNGEEVWDVI